MNKFFALLVLITTFFLAGCGSSEDKIAQLEADNLQLAQSKLTAQAELKFMKAEVARRERQDDAIKEVAKVARAVVRTHQITDRSACRIIPASLVRVDYYGEFKTVMNDRYGAGCRGEVVKYIAERKQAAKQAVADANKAKKQKIAKK